MFHKILKFVAVVAAMSCVSCALVGTSAFVGEDPKWEHDSWRFKPILVEDSASADSQYFRAHIYASRISQYAPPRPALEFDSVTVSTDSDKRMSLPFEGFSYLDDSSGVFDYGGFAVGPESRTLALRAYGSGEPVGMDFPSDSSPPHLLEKHHESYLVFFSTNDRPIVKVDPRFSIVGAVSHKQSEHMRVWNYLAVGIGLHSPDGNWTYSFSWPLVERTKVDSVWYLSSILPHLPPIATYSIVFGALTPDFDVQRNLTRTHKAKVFIGLDIHPGVKTFSDGYEPYDVVDGVLFSPKLGFHWRVWALQLRVSGALNYWRHTGDRIPPHPTNLGPSIGFSLWSGPEFWPTRRSAPKKQKKIN